MILEFIDKNMRWIMAGLGILIVISLALSLSQCNDHGESEQVKQSKASAEAISEAAKNAIEVVQTQQANEQTINDAVEQTKGDIKDAKSVEAIRASVIAGLCSRPSFQHDPSCLRP